jgi:glycosyltransferase involved in cell wall biosynthesis
MIAPHEREGESSPARDASYRVLMIAATSFFADYGCHVRILEEARILQKLGHQVTICTYHNGRDLSDQDIRRTMSIPWRHDYEVGSSRHKMAFDVLLFLRTLSLMPSIRPHILHAHGYEAALIGYVLSNLWGTPLVFDRQGSLTGEMVDHHFLDPKGSLYGFWRRLEHWIDRVSPRILTSTAHAASLMDRPVGEHRIVCLPDCVNTDVFSPRPRNEAWGRLKRAWGIPTQHLVVIYLGLLAEYQGTDHLLRAAQRVCHQRDDVHFVIAGFPNMERYQTMARELGIADHVVFPGRVPYEDAPRVLSLGDVAVAPKLSQTEGAGKLLNYMAMGLPTVAFDTEVSREYLGSLGVMARRGDEEDLAKRLLELLDNPQERQTMSAQLRQRAIERFSWDSSADILLDTYAALSNPDRGSRRNEQSAVMR